MEIVKSTKKLGSDFEQMVESGLEKGKEVLSNVASYLPFSNLAKNREGVYTIEVDLPGVKKEEIELSIKGNYLNVSAVRQTKNEVKEEDYYLKESFYGKIERAFFLPNDLDTEHIDANYEDGRLTITLNKIESAIKIVPITILIGARQTGKTSLLESFKSNYVTFALDGQLPDTNNLFNDINNVISFLKIKL